MRRCRLGVSEKLKTRFTESNSKREHILKAEHCIIKVFIPKNTKKIANNT